MFTMLTEVNRYLHSLSSHTQLGFRREAIAYRILVNGNHTLSVA